MRSDQSRRFLASGFLTIAHLKTCYDQLTKNQIVSYVCMSEMNIYVEIKQKRTLLSFKSSVQNIPNIEIAAYNTVGEVELLFEHGKPMSRIKKPETFDQTKITPSAVYQQVRYYKKNPEFGDIYLPSAAKAEVDAAISAARHENYKEEYTLNLYPWQERALQLLVEQRDRKVLWIFDKDGGTGKTEFLHYLQYKQGYQYLIGASANDLGGMIDINANGYCIDLMRSTKRNGDVFNLIEQITNGEIQTTKYLGRKAHLLSKTVVVVANYMPNLAALSLDRWCVFHTKLGEIQLQCEQHGTNGYRCTIAKTMSNTAGQSFKIIADEAIPDSEL